MALACSEIDVHGTCTGREEDAGAWKEPGTCLLGWRYRKKALGLSTEGLSNCYTAVKSGSCTYCDGSTVRSAFDTSPFFATDRRRRHAISC